MGNAHESFGHDLTDAPFGLMDVWFGLTDWVFGLRVAGFRMRVEGSRAGKIDKRDKNQEPRHKKRLRVSGIELSIVNTKKQIPNSSRRLAVGSWQSKKFKFKSGENRKWARDNGQ
ncbi:hypothetical protein [Flagellimonas sp.]|uniref:hypothetical protein n=1 Tax=Flagellimonas sp. TaxID=2058762 RepID=UPI003BADB5F6